MFLKKEKFLVLKMKIIYFILKLIENVWNLRYRNFYNIFFIIKFLFLFLVDRGFFIFFIEVNFYVVRRFRDVLIGVEERERGLCIVVFFFKIGC